MSENRVKWHPYPQEKPKKSDGYLITVKRYKDSHLFVIGDYFHDDLKIFGFEAEALRDKVIAWAEMPEPYKGGIYGQA